MLAMITFFLTCDLPYCRSVRERWASLRFSMRGSIVFPSWLVFLWTSIINGLPIEEILKVKLFCLKKIFLSFNRMFSGFCWAGLTSTLSFRGSMSKELTADGYFMTSFALSSDERPISRMSDQANWKKNFLNFLICWISSFKRHLLHLVHTGGICRRCQIRRPRLSV